MVRAVGPRLNAGSTASKVIYFVWWLILPLAVTFFVWSSVIEFFTFYSIEHNHAQATGQVVSTSVSGRYGTHFTYAFQVGGTYYTGQSYDSSRSGNIPAALTIWYNPQNPAQNMDAPNDIAAFKAWSWAPLVLLAISYAIPAWIAWRLFGKKYK